MITFGKPVETIKEAEKLIMNAANVAYLFAIIDMLVIPIRHSPSTQTHLSLHL
ncbi:MAG: hypothetical protein K9M03_03830 [Kiritimatiellales bacterium]|nr:hypothetical protein [Kiritimatiellales bacterium]